MADMTGLVLPAVARAALRTLGPAELVARKTGPLHLYAGSRPGLGDFTRSGALRHGRRLVCGQPARRWYLADPDGRPLCARCTTWARRHLDLTGAPVSAQDLADTLACASTVDQVDAAQHAAILHGLTTIRVAHPDPLLNRAPLHRVLARTRSRLTPAHVTAADRAWMQRVNAQATRFPRRIA